MEQIIVIIHVFISLGIIGLVLVQHGKGADIGATFGGGVSNTMFGSQGAMPFMMKVTAVLAVIFFANCLALGYLVGHRSAGTMSGLSAAGPVKVTSSSKAKQPPKIVFPSVQKTTQDRASSK